MDNQVLKCLHDTKLLLLHADNDNWDAFNALQTQWVHEVKDCFLENQQSTASEQHTKLLKSLIDDVDEVCLKIKDKMQVIEGQFTENRQSKKALTKYLK